MAPHPPAKILRVALVQNKKITEERHFKKRQDVTVGQDARSTFVVPASNLPSSFPVFEHKNQLYALCFTEQMSGKVRVGPNEGDYVDFATLRAQGMAKKRGELFVLPLTEQMRGTVNLGEITLLFQFATPPPEPAKPELPINVKGSVFQSLDRLFFGILAGSLLIHFSGAGYIACQPRPPERELSLDELPDRFAKVLMPVKAPEPEPVRQEAAAGEEEKKEEKKAEGDDKKPNKPKAADAATQKAALQQKVASKGLLKILGSQGAGSGAFEDVLGAGTGTGDIASALAGAGGVGIATADAIGAGGPKGGGSGQVAGIGDLGTSGGGNVNLGSKADKGVSGRVRDEGPEVESADVDREALSRYVRQRLKAIQSCYEKELKRNPSIKGKVVVRFSIGTSGRAKDVEIEENTLGSEAVASCIRTTIRAWVFPFKPDDDVPVAYPFVFSPAS